MKNQKFKENKANVTIGDIEKLVNIYSSKASEYCHQLGIAGVVIVWVLQNYSTEHSIVDIKSLRISFLLFIISITISLLHYAVLAVMSDFYYHKKVKEVPSDNIVELKEKFVEDSKPIEYLSWIFFVMKLITLLAGYFIIIYFGYTHLFNI
jgi:hypothetical protein